MPGRIGRNHERPAEPERAMTPPGLSLLTLNVGNPSPERARRQLAWLSRRDEHVLVLTETKPSAGCRLGRPRRRRLPVRPRLLLRTPGRPGHRLLLPAPATRGRAVRPLGADHAPGCSPAGIPAAEVIEMA